MFDVYSHLRSNTCLSILIFITPIIVLIPGLLKIYNCLRNNKIKSKTKKQEKNNIILNTYKYALIAPVMFLIIILSCGVYTKFSLVTPNLFVLDTYFNNYILFIVFTFLNLFLAHIFYLNLGLLVIKDNKNYIMNIIITYVVILLVSLFFELIIGKLLALVTNISIFGNIFSLFNVWENSDCGNILYVTIFLLFINCISSLFVFKKYKNTNT